MSGDGGMVVSEPELFGPRFELLTGHAPFPWQQALYRRFIDGDLPPRVCVPTGLGKTNVIAVWLLALTARPRHIARRLVYVVNRRTVVDQTTTEVEALRENLPKLRVAGFDTLAISTLRGQFADNREWSADPSRPAVICGTVDMIGSRLLFNGYGVGYRARPLHAAFLGQDVLLVHDEAHLEPAFQRLIETVQREQTQGENAGNLPWPALRVMALSATVRDDGPAAAERFELQPADHADADVRQRLCAAKRLHLHPCQDEKKALVSQILEKAEEAAEKALAHDETEASVLVFVRRVKDALDVLATLQKKHPDRVASLTGTLRGYERDGLVRDPVFVRFLPPSDRPAEVTPAQGAVYLVCTSAGEVGVNLSADHMVCDLTTFESMAQRLGRVNRFGERSDTRIDVVYPKSFDEKDPLTPAREATLKLLESLDGNASPAALEGLDNAARSAAFSPEPVIPPATDILFDAWALTSIRPSMPGRPPVEPYLHGIAEWQPPETHVAWRDEVEIVTGDLLARHSPADLLDDYPLKPHELLRDRSDRVYTQLEALAKRHPARPVWVLDDRGAVDVTTLAQLTSDTQRKGRINGCTVLLPPSAGGLSRGMLVGKSADADDVADIAPPAVGARLRLWSTDDDYDTKTAGMRRVRSIAPGDPEADDASEPCRWEWFESLPLEGGRTAARPVELAVHAQDVVQRAEQLTRALELPAGIADAVVLAAGLHDSGKRRERFQTTLGNRGYPDVLLAKAGRRGARLPEPFRHEFASLFEVQADPRFAALDDDAKDLVLHLVAAHHGRARPHFAAEEAYDPDRPDADAEALACETPRRYARLQRRYGRWGLAYLESLLRAADWAASAEPSATLEDNP